MVGNCSIDYHWSSVNGISMGFFPRYTYNPIHIDIFFLRFSTCMLVALYIFSPLFPLSSLLYTFLFLSFPSNQKSQLPWECDRRHSFLCCIAFAWGHRVIVENLRWYSRPFNRVCFQSTVSGMQPSVQRFDVQAADRRSPIQVLI